MREGCILVTLDVARLADILSVVQEQQQAFGDAAATSEEQAHETFRCASQVSLERVEGLWSGQKQIKGCTLLCCFLRVFKDRSCQASWMSRLSNALLRHCACVFPFPGDR